MRGGGAVTPGFIDAHTHVSQHLGRGSIPDTWPEDREHEQWLPYWTHMTPEDDDASTTLACLEMVRNGTTAFSDLGGHFEVERKAAIVERIGLRGVLTEIAWDRAAASRGWHRRHGPDPAPARTGGRRAAVPRPGRARLGRRRDPGHGHGQRRVARRARRRWPIATASCSSRTRRSATPTRPGVPATMRAA